MQRMFIIYVVYACMSRMYAMNACTHARMQQGMHVCKACRVTRRYAIDVMYVCGVCHACMYACMHVCRVCM